MAARTARATGGSRPPTEIGPEVPEFPPTPKLSSEEVEPTLGDIYRLLQHLNNKVSLLENQITAIKNMVVDQEGAISAMGKEFKGYGLALGEIQQTLGNLHPSTPETQTRRPDVDPTPCPGILRPAARVKSPSRSRSREEKPLGASLLPSRSPSPSGFTLFPPGTTPGRFPTPGTTVVPKIKEPDAFDGTRGKKATDWALRALIWARHMLPTFPNEESLVLHLLGLTKDRGADWARPHIGRIMQKKSGALTTLRRFSEEFERNFNDPDAKRMAARKLNELTQSSDVETYITDFENLEAELDWNEAALQATFEKGLHWKVKELLSQVYPAPATFEEVKNHARRIDATRRENEASRPKRDNVQKRVTTATSKNTTPTTRVALTESPNFVSPEERDKRRAENLCIKCGSPDHKFRECKNGWKKERVAGKGKKKEETAKIAEAESEVESSSEN